MSLPSRPSGSAPIGQYRKPRADLYTVMLLIALLALIIGTVMLYLETLDYGSPPYQGAPSASVLPASLEQPAVPACALASSGVLVPRAGPAQAA